MRFSVLGPVRVNDGSVALSAAKERTVLTVLLTNANSAVSADRLIDALWQDAPPRTATKTLQTYVHHLRRFLGDRLETVAGGYRLRVEGDELDALVFEHELRRGRLALLRGDTAEAVAVLTAALSTWRGAPYADADGSDVEIERSRLEELRLAAEEHLAEARVAAGPDEALIGDLEALTKRHPLRERLWGQLMLALYRAGRQADALRAYQRARAVLVTEIGVEPGPELRQIEQAILEQRIELDRSATQLQATTRYVRAPDGARVAYRTAGGGGNDVVFVVDSTHSIELAWELGSLRPVLAALSEHGRLTLFQRRGTGCSDRDRDGSFTPPQACVDDLDAVLDALGASKVKLVGWGHGGQVSVAYASARPERVDTLVLVNTYARLARAPDYPAGYPLDQLDAFLAYVAANWGSPDRTGLSPVFGADVPVDDRFVATLSRLERLTFSPGEVCDVLRAVNDFDVRRCLATVRCRTLVAVTAQSVTGVANARYVADHIADATYVELPGAFMPTSGEAGALAAAVRAFLDPKP